METKYKIKNKERRGPDSEKKWGILKYLSAEIFIEKSEVDQGQTAYECRVQRHVSVTSRVKN